MGHRLYLTIVSVLAGLLIFAGIALPVRSYSSYQEALKADLRVLVDANVLSHTVADPDEGLDSNPSAKKFYAPVVHFDYIAPGEDTPRQGELLIPFSKYWSHSPEGAQKLGEELHPVGSAMDLYLSEKDSGKFALRPSLEPTKNYLLLTPVGLILFLLGVSLLVHRSRMKNGARPTDALTEDCEY